MKSFPVATVAQPPAPPIIGTDSTRRRRRRERVLTVALIAVTLIATAAVVVAVNQRSVARRWRDAAAASAGTATAQAQARADQEARVQQVTHDRDQLERRITALAGEKAALGDKTQAFVVLAGRATSLLANHVCDRDPESAGCAAWVSDVRVVLDATVRSSGDTQ